MVAVHFGLSIEPPAQAATIRLSHRCWVRASAFPLAGTGGPLGNRTPFPLPVAGIGEPLTARGGPILPGVGTGGPLGNRTSFPVPVAGTGEPLTARDVPRRSRTTRA